MQTTEVLYKKGVLENFAKFREKHTCQSLFIKKVEGPRLQKVVERCFVFLSSFSPDANSNKRKWVLYLLIQHRIRSHALKTLLETMSSDGESFWPHFCHYISSQNLHVQSQQ